MQYLSEISLKHLAGQPPARFKFVLKSSLCSMTSKSEKNEVVDSLLSQVSLEPYLLGLLGKATPWVGPSYLYVPDSLFTE